MENIIIAITGPSGVGKNTLGNILIKKDDFVVPVHTTTRSQRNDDIIGFYRYLTHNEFKNYASKNNFLFWSGDSDVIDSKYGNYYGILRDDYNAISNNDRIIFYISYKDICAINELRKCGYNIEIVNLLYYDIDKSMKDRLLSGGRNHSEEDIKRRIECAKSYERQFREQLDNYDILKIYTDLYDPEATYEIVKTKKLNRGV